MTKRPEIKGFSRIALTVAACLALSVGCENNYIPAEWNDDGPAPTDARGNDADAGVLDVPDDRGPAPTDVGGYDGDVAETGEPDIGERDRGEPNGSDGGGAPDGEPSGIDFRPQKSRVLLVIDRSGSMAEAADCPEVDCPSKWEQLLALGVYLAEIKRSAHIGLALFPDPVEEGCSVGSRLVVPLTDAPDVDEQIMSVLRQTQPGGRTPLAEAMDLVGRVGGLDDPEMDNVLVFLTDGQPNCACATGEIACERDAAVAAAERLENLDSNLNVYVVGFGASAQVAHETLTAVADVAGRRYYQADTIEELISKLYEVAVENAPCTYELQQQPYPDSVVVWFDEEQVPACSEASCEDGYTYDSAIGEVEFHGVWCDALRSLEPPAISIDTQP